MDVKVYGTGTSGHQMVSGKVSEALKNAEIDFSIENIENVDRFIKDMISSVPAIRLDDGQVFEINANGRFNSSLRKAVQSILKTKDYGAMPKIIVPSDLTSNAMAQYNFARKIAQKMNGVLYVSQVQNPDGNQDSAGRKKLQDLVDSSNQDWIGDIVKEPFAESLYFQGDQYESLIEMTNHPNTVMVLEWPLRLCKSEDNDSSSCILQLINEIHCPCFYIPGSFEKAGIKKVFLMAHSLNDNEEAIRKAIDICMLLEAELTIGYQNEAEEESLALALKDKLSSEGCPVDIHFMVIENAKQVALPDRWCQHVDCDLCVIQKGEKNEVISNTLLFQMLGNEKKMFYRAVLLLS